MIHSFSKTIIAACVLAGSVGMANAAIGPITTQTADITFAQPQEVTLTLTPVADLVAGTIPDGTKVVDANLATISGQPGVFAVRWTPGIGTLDPDDHRAVTVNGHNTDSPLKLYYNTSAQDGTIGLDDTWFLTSEQGADPVTTDHNTVWTSGNQDIPADTYTISIDAAIWTA